MSTIGKSSYLQLGYILPVSRMSLHVVLPVRHRHWSASLDLLQAGCSGTDGADGKNKWGDK